MTQKGQRFSTQRPIGSISGPAMGTGRLHGRAEELSIRGFAFQIHALRAARRRINKLDTGD